MKTFVYGSLLSPRVLNILLGRTPQTQPAKLSGYHRFRVRDRAYPAIFPKVDGFIEGNVLMDLDQREKEILDRFEDVEYEQRQVEVELLTEKNEKLQVFVYVYPKDENLYGTWDFKVFEETQLEAFCEMCLEFAKGDTKRVPF